MELQSHDHALQPSTSQSVEGNKTDYSRRNQGVVDNTVNELRVYLLEYRQCKEHEQAPE